MNNDDSEKRIEIKLREAIRDINTIKDRLVEGIKLTGWSQSCEYCQEFWICYHRKNLCTVLEQIDPSFVFDSKIISYVNHVGYFCNYYKKRIIK